MLCMPSSSFSSVFCVAYLVLLLPDQHYQTSMSAQEAKNWKKRMHSMIEREVAQEFVHSKSGYARYQPGMSADQLKAVLDFHQRDSTGAGLPKKSELEAEIRRFGGASFDKQIKTARRDDLINLLCRAIKHKPRRWLDRYSRDAPKRYHRFGLTFNYKGDYPKPEYREGMDGEELRAMLELHPDVKMTVPQIKTALMEQDPYAKRTGSKTELLKRLKDALGESSFGRNETYTAVACWANEKAALQARFDAERAEWQKEIETNADWKDFATRSAVSKAKAAAKQKKADDAKKKVEADREQMASMRPWRCQTYDPTKTTRVKMEAYWRQHHSFSSGKKLSFAYSGYRIPPPEAFGEVMMDWRTSSYKYGHHLLAYLEVGYGKLDFVLGHYNASHRYMSKESLKEIHGRTTMSLATSLQYAIDVLRRDVSTWADYRFRNGL